ncbi:MAG: hypothetical protein JW709_00035 [Sedimentisphaerales bacterium]|nr:hypothetical protein [Sedimentisphaerales bacterium]
MGICTQLRLWRILICLCLTVSIAWTQEKPEIISDEARLLEKWETIQKNDPQNLVFEKIGDGLYHFKTKRFPYDGELRVYSVIIEKENNWDQFPTGNITVELLNLPDHFFDQYSTNYFRWANLNKLYLDIESGDWISEDELTNKSLSKLHNKQPGFPDIPDTSDPLKSTAWSYRLLIVFSIFIIGIVLYTVVRYIIYIKEMNKNFSINKESIIEQQQLQSEQEKRVKESFRLANETNRLLQEILNKLKKTKE